MVHGSLQFQVSQSQNGTIEVMIKDEESTDISVEAAISDIVTPVITNDSIVVNVMSDGMKQIVDDDSVIVDALQDPAISSADRNPIVDFFQNIFSGQVSVSPDPQISLEPPDECSKCS